MTGLAMSRIFRGSFYLRSGAALCAALACILLVSCSRVFEDIPVLDNFTCDLEVTEDFGVELSETVLNDILTERMSEEDLDPYRNEKGEISAGDFRLVIRTYFVSEEEIYFRLLLKHLGSDTVVYVYELSEEKGYSYEDAAGLFSYDVIYSRTDVRHCLSMVKWKTFEKNIRYVGFDLTYIESSDDGYFFDENVYGIDLDKEGLVEKITCIYNRYRIVDGDLPVIDVKTRKTVSSDVYEFAIRDIGLTGRP